MEYKIKFRLKELVKEHDISLRELARLSDIEPSIINKMANNRRNSVYFQHLERIAESLNLDSLDQIIYFEKIEDEE